MRKIKILLLMLLSCTILFFNIPDINAGTVAEECSYYAPPNEPMHASVVKVECTIYANFTRKHRAKLVGSDNKEQISNCKKPLHSGFALN